MKNHMLTIKRGRFESKSKKWFFLRQPFGLHENSSKNSKNWKIHVYREVLM